MSEATRPSDPLAVGGVIGRIVQAPLALIDESLRDKIAIWNPSDSLKAKVRAEHRKIGGQIPIVSRVDRRGQGARDTAEYLCHSGIRSHHRCRSIR